MGFIKQSLGWATGANDINASTARNAKAQEDATKAAAESQTAALQANAQAAADAQAQAAARSAVEDQAAAAVSAPLRSADVQLQSNASDTVAGARNKRQASFGRNYSGGVSI